SPRRPAPSAVQVTRHSPASLRGSRTRPRRSRHRATPDRSPTGQGPGSRRTARSPAPCGPNAAWVVVQYVANSSRDMPGLLLAPMLVATAPGHSTEDRTDEWAERSSRSNVAISATTPCLATLYGPAVPPATSPAIDAVELMWPCSCCSINGRKVLTP